MFLRNRNSLFEKQLLPTANHYQLPAFLNSLILFLKYYFMRKQIVLAILLVSVTLVSFNSKEISSDASVRLKNATAVCGPAFDSIYNQHSTVIISTISVHDPLGNFFPVGGLIEPGDVVTLGASGSMSGNAGGTYGYTIRITNGNGTGSISILDQFNNVIDCQDITTRTLFHFSFNATCATTYRIVVSNSSC